MDSNAKLVQKTKRALTAAASLAASAMLALTIINDYLPPEIRSYLSSVTPAALRARLSTQDTIIIGEHEESYRNPIFNAAKAYIATKVITTAASLAASAMLARTLINDFLPYKVRDYLLSVIDSLRSRLSTQHTIIIKEKEGFATNQIFHAAEIYIATRISSSLRRLRVSKLSNNKQKTITLSLEQGEVMEDVYEGVHIKWLFLSQHSKSRDGNDDPTEKQSFELTFHHKHKEMVLGSYLPYILERAKAIEVEDRTLCLRMNDGDFWEMIKLHHPATFDTLAMEPKVKQELMDDLARFVKRKDYYKRIGKAWKRGYLLYGPPGTGKSSLVAAMANYLKFDIYNLELGEVRCNKSLQRLLVGMANKSILVVEDIDCSIDLNNREAEVERTKIGPGREDKVTLSGLLNSVDGLWSCTGEERIIVFTTNYKDHLDSALLRPGRMDMHIHMGYCGVAGFKMLASNYHSVDDHPLFREIEKLIKEAEVTPAEVAEQLMRSDDTEIALKGFIEFLEGLI